MSSRQYPGYVCITMRHGLARPKFTAGLRGRQLFPHQRPRHPLRDSATSRELRRKLGINRDEKDLGWRQTGTHGAREPKSRGNTVTGFSRHLGHLIFLTYLHTYILSSRSSSRAASSTRGRARSKPPRTNPDYLERILIGPNTPGGTHIKSRKWNKGRYVDSM